jgi:hypothetical protein
MPSLRELQLAFLDAVLADAPERALPLLAPPPVRAGDTATAQRLRLGVYANNVVANAMRALELGYPTVLALGGREWLAGAARAFLHAHPSRSGDLHALGAPFPEFLAAFLGDGPCAYFADVARLERAYQEVTVAADAPALDLAALATVGHARHAELVFVPHPAARLVDSAWPILDLWRAYRAGDGTGTRVDLAAGAQRVLVIRRTDHVELAPITADEAALYATCTAGRTLGQAVDALGSDFPLAAALRSLVARGALTGFRLAAPAAAPVEAAPTSATVRNAVRERNCAPAERGPL